MKPTILRDYSLVHSVRIAVYNKRYPLNGVSYETIDHWTMPCIRNVPSYCHKHHATHLISIGGTIAQSTQYSIIYTYVVFRRLTGCHTKINIMNAKVVPTKMALILYRFFLFILININMLFATK